MTATAPASQPRQRRDGSQYYLWDAHRVDLPAADLFDPQAWRAAGRLAGQASGRGAAWFLRPQQGGAWVLRHSRRGGLVACISHDRYLWLGVDRCRVMQEFRLLTALRQRGLPVPVPVAARVVRHGSVYTGDLITVEVEGARPLADWLAEATLDAATWRRIGTTIGSFHGAGVYHHDLNARNILIGEDRTVTLIDFDKSAIRKVGCWQRTNLARLRRSLDKFADREQTFHFPARDWDALVAGYNAASEC